MNEDKIYDWLLHLPMGPPESYLKVKHFQCSALALVLILVDVLVLALVLILVFVLWRNIPCKRQFPEWIKLIKKSSRHWFSEILKSHQKCQKTYWKDVPGRLGTSLGHLLMTLWRNYWSEKNTRGAAAKPPPPCILLKPPISSKSHQKMSQRGPRPTGASFRHLFDIFAMTFRNPGESMPGWLLITFIHFGQCHLQGTLLHNTSTSTSIGTSTSTSTSTNTSINIRTEY